MKKNKEYIIAGSLLGLAIVGMVCAYNVESGDKKAQEKEEQQIAFQEVEESKEESKDEVEDVSNILEAKQKEQNEETEKEAEEAEQAQEPQTEETSSAPAALQFKESLMLPLSNSHTNQYTLEGCHFCIVSQGTSQHLPASESRYSHG